VQLARLGDIVQSLPVIEALRRHGHGTIDAVCAEPLVPVLRACPVLKRVLPWDGSHWSALADRWRDDADQILASISAWLKEIAEGPYDWVYNLNQHARSIMLAHLLGKQVLGAGADGALATSLPTWGAYLRNVAAERAGNRVHLADAWCGMCGVKPLGRAPHLIVPAEPVPSDLSAVGQEGGLWVAIVIGAGDPARCVPPSAWAQWIRLFLSRVPEGQILLVGTGHEREAGQTVHDELPPLLHARLWDATGRTTLSQLMQLLARCRWVLGADTGPLHLATAVGAQAMGFYFARARVHETGPYGVGHRVFQHAGERPPASWPWAESIAVLLGEQMNSMKDWALWESRLDQWGACYIGPDQDNGSLEMRETVWRRLSPDVVGSIAA
jgi:ADP-heptose:LPS heptosyltransferase